ncbi:hypothetical protein QO179_24645 [Bacillus stercoris]|nr:hypothetical protein [Bacillus stercoris]
MAKVDWAFTEDGDLSLGDPMVNVEGQILYKQLDGTVSIDKGDNGKEIRDIGVAYDLEAEKQTIMNRLRTDSPDWYHHPAMGGNLTDLIGEPNTKETGTKGASYIYDALTYEGLYNQNQISVRPVPISPTELIFMIEITKFNTETIRLPLIFSLESGLMDVYETPKAEDPAIVEPPPEVIDGGTTEPEGVE